MTKNRHKQLNNNNFIMSTYPDNLLQILKKKGIRYKQLPNKWVFGFDIIIAWAIAHVG